MKVPGLVSIAAALTLFIPSCGTSPTTEEKPPSGAPARVSPEDVQFHTRADTVTALHGAEHGTVGAPGRTEQIRFMVQIGAYKDPHHASVVQAEARKRYAIPVLNDFYAGAGLYQIRIGFFESREAARAFQQKMQRDYPSDYKDSWIVQLKR